MAHHPFDTFIGALGPPGSKLPPLDNYCGTAVAGSPALQFSHPRTAAFPPHHPWKSSEGPSHNFKFHRSLLYQSIGLISLGINIAASGLSWEKSEFGTPAAAATYRLIPSLHPIIIIFLRVISGNKSDPQLLFVGVSSTDPDEIILRSVPWVGSPLGIAYYTPTNNNLSITVTSNISHPPPRTSWRSSTQLTSPLISTIAVTYSF